MEFKDASHRHALSLLCLLCGMRQFNYIVLAIVLCIYIGSNNTVTNWFYVFCLLGVFGGQRMEVTCCKALFVHAIKKLMISGNEKLSQRTYIVIPIFCRAFLNLHLTPNNEFKIMGWCELGYLTIHLFGLIKGHESICPEVILSVRREGNLTETDV